LILLPLPGSSDGCPVALRFTIGLYGASVRLVHAILGVRAPPPKPAAWIRTVAWTEEQLTMQGLMLG
jgi:hypothetical protein